MKKLDRLIRLYNSGNYTATDLMLEVLQIITPDNVHLVVSSLPMEVRLFLKQFVSYYHPGVRVFNAPIPSMEVIQIVKECFSEKPSVGDEAET